jgi:hypothetical protein
MDGWFGGGEGLELEMESWEQQLDAELHSSGIQLDWAVGLAPLQVGPAVCISNTSPFILDGGVQAPSPALLWDVGAQVLQQHSSDSSRSGSGSGCGNGMAVAPALAATGNGARKGGSAVAAKAAGKGVGKTKASSSAAATRYSTPAARARKQEQQRQYRQRFKQRQSQQEAEVHTAAWLRDQLLAERAELQVQEQALLRLEEHCSAMAHTLLPPGAHGAGAADAAPQQVLQQDPAQDQPQASGGPTSAFENVGGKLLLRTWYPDVGSDVGTGAVQPQQVAQALDAVLGEQSSPCLRSEPMQAAQADPPEPVVDSLLSQCIQSMWQQRQQDHQQQQQEGQQALSPSAHSARQEQGAATPCNEASGGEVHGSGGMAPSFTGRVANLLMCNLPDGIWSSLLLPRDRQLR